MSFLAQALLTIALAAFALYLFFSLKVREFAVSAAKKHCKKMELQLLDQSVSMQKLRLVKKADHTLQLQRVYYFEFTSTGDERYHGKLTMLGNRLFDIELQAHRLPETHIDNPQNKPPIN